MQQLLTKIRVWLLPCFIWTLAAIFGGCSDPVHGIADHIDSNNEASPPATSERNPNLARLQQLGYTGYVESDEIDRPSGAVIHDASAMAPGVNLLSIHKLCKARLVDAEGRILHEWSIPGETWGHAELLPDGSILAPLFTGTESFLVKIDWDNQLIWRLPYSAHHDAEVLPDGRIALLAFANRDLPSISEETQVRDDQLLVLDSEGEKLEQYSITELLDAAPDWKFEEVEAGETELDLLHTNSVAWMRPELAALGELYATGNVLISMRHQNRVVILRPSTGELLWSWGAEELIGQHDATVLDNGNVLIFDNGLGRGWSRGLEVDPVTDEIVWEWRAPEQEQFYTIARGAIQRFENGNTLLARIIHERAHQTSQKVAFGSLSAPDGTLRILPSSTTRKGRLRRQNPQSTVRNQVVVSDARLHE